MSCTLQGWAFRWTRGLAEPSSFVRLRMDHGLCKLWSLQSQSQQQLGWIEDASQYIPTVPVGWFSVPLRISNGSFSFRQHPSSRLNFPWIYFWGISVPSLCIMKQMLPGRAASEHRYGNCPQQWESVKIRTGSPALFLTMATARPLYLAYRIVVPKDYSLHYSFPESGSTPWMEGFLFPCYGVGNSPELREGGVN